MSGNLAVSLPTRAPREVEEHPRHIEVISTRAQRKARPRVVYALVAVAGLFVILMSQLLLSILLSDGAYQIASLQQNHTELARDQQTLTEELHVLHSPQNLSAQAAALGMIANGSGAGWFRLSDGTVLQPASPARAAVTGTTEAPPVANQLITPQIAGLGATDPNATDPNGLAANGAPAGTTGTGSVPSGPGVLPSPQTH
ncbi:hypothetical protein [Glaciihabitans sp. UYNi722]|uniref:hypothetical protein n=1 Tax=Glaciihabitans sp. UYNi722 TaxID=3156344 RepID=UPI003399AAE9